MKSLYESIFDVDDNIDKLEIPAKPKVSKDDYPAYEQAWHDALVELLDKSRKSSDYAVFFKIYKEWLSDWIIYGNSEDYFNDYGDDIDWYVDYVNFLHKNNERKYLERFLDDLTEECIKGASPYRMSPQGSGSFLYAMYDTEDMFCQALSDNIFSFGKFAPSYKKFKKDIDKILKFYIK